MKSPIKTVIVNESFELITNGKAYWVRPVVGLNRAMTEEYVGRDLTAALAYFRQKSSAAK